MGAWTNCPISFPANSCFRQYKNSNDEYALFGKLGFNIDSFQLESGQAKSRYLSYYNRNNIPLIAADWLFVIDINDGHLQDSIQLDGQNCHCLILNNVERFHSLEALVSKLDAEYSEDHYRYNIRTSHRFESSRFRYRIFLKIWIMKKRRWIWNKII